LFFAQQLHRVLNQSEEARLSLPILLSVSSCRLKLIKFETRNDSIVISSMSKILVNIKNLFPLIVPTTYVGTSWNPLYQKFNIPEFVLTWAEFKDSSPMIYLTETRYIELNNNIKHWQQQSFENLRHKGEYFHTQTKYSNHNKNIVFISFLNIDGIGSSRILLNTEFSKAFPGGYYLAFPDRSCGLIISKDITDKDLKETQLLIKNMYKTASTPMTSKIYDPSEFTLPNDWTSPIDKEFSKQIINAIDANAE
jgi:hypothetical protein